MRRIVRRIKAKNKRKALAKTKYPPFFADGDAVCSLLAGFEKRPVDSRLTDEWQHVSSILHGDCPRAMLIANKMDKAIFKRPRLADRLLWTIGKAVEKHIRECLIKIHGMHRCYGLWRCACGDSEHNGFGDPQMICNNCNRGLTEYDEHIIKDDELILSGAPDLLILDDRDKFVVIEIKSIKVGGNTASADFTKLNGPIRLHTMQALTYNLLLARSGFTMSDEVVIVYGAKDYIFKMPFKAFVEDVNEPRNVQASDNILTEANKYAEAKRSGDMLSRLHLCSNCKTTRAKACPVVGPCFNMTK